MQLETKRNVSLCVSNLPNYVKNELQSILQALAKCEEQVDGLVFTLAGLVTTSGPSSSAQRPSSPRVVSDPTRVEQRALAAAGVGSVQRLPSSNGSAIFKIDGGTSLPLSRALAELLQVLYADSGTSEDSLVGWKSIGDLKLALAKRLGGAFTTHAIKQLVFRLRNELESHGENRLLVQNHRKLGYRFALRRGGDL